MKFFNLRRMLPCFYAFFTNGMMVLMIGAIMPHLISEAEINYSTAGGFLSAFAIGNLLASFIAPWISRYIGRRKAIMFLSALIPAFLFIITLMPPIIFIYIAFIFIGIGRGSVSIVNNVVVNELDGRAATMNLLHTMFAIGAFLGPLLTVLYLNLGFGWRFPVYTIILLSLIATLSFTTLQDENKITKNKELTKSNHDKGIFKNVDFYIIAFVLFFYLGAENCINGWFVTYFKASGIMSDAYATNLVSITWLLIMVGRIFNAYISLGVSKEYVIIANCILSILFFMLLISTSNLIVITIAICGLGFFFSGIYPTSVANAGVFIKGSTAGMSYLLAIAALGGIIMPQIIGIIADKSGIYNAISLLSFCILMMVVFAGLNVIRYIKNNQS